MTITNDERRKVAARLRHVAGHGAPEWATTACCIAECLGEDDYPLWNDSKPLFTRLANLIEQDTCERIECKFCKGEALKLYHHGEYAWSDKFTFDLETKVNIFVCVDCGKVTIEQNLEE